MVIKKEPGKRMMVKVFQDRHLASLAAANEIAALVSRRNKEESRCVLALPTGKTPLELYRELIRIHREEGLSFARVVFFNLDEYWPMAPDDPHSYHYYMRDHFFRHIDVRPEQTHIPSGVGTEDEVAACAAQYDREIEQVGGLDLLVLGVGRNGHIGFNEPGATPNSVTGRVKLADSTRYDAIKDFGSLEAVPRFAVTMGLKTMLQARRVLCLAFGKGKAEIMAQALEGPVTAEHPATYLRQVAGVKVFLDREAAALLNGGSNATLDSSAVAKRQ